MKPTRFTGKEKDKEGEMNRLIEVSTTTKLITEECCDCGVIFAMPSELRHQLLDKGGTFYCPSGHGQHYTDTIEHRLRVAEDKLRHEKMRSAELSNQLDGTLGKLKDNKNELRRVKRRVEAGVCTECHRHFDNLQRHMETKHK